MLNDTPNPVTVYKKVDKLLINNYQPTLSFSMFMLKIVFRSPFTYVDTSSIKNTIQSGFHVGDSWVHQLLLIMHDIYKPNIDTKELFLMINLQIGAILKLWSILGLLLFLVYIYYPSEGLPLVAKLFANCFIFFSCTWT